MSQEEDKRIAEYQKHLILNCVFALNMIMGEAAKSGNEKNVRMCYEFGSNAHGAAMSSVAENGHEDIVRLCHTWGAGATELNWAMENTSEYGHVAIVHQCLEWGATSIDETMDWPSMVDMKRSCDYVWSGPPRPPSRRISRRPPAGKKMRLSRRKNCG